MCCSFFTTCRATSLAVETVQTRVFELQSSASWGAGSSELTGRPQCRPSSSPNLLEVVGFATDLASWEALRFLGQGAALSCTVSFLTFPRDVDILRHYLGLRGAHRGGFELVDPANLKADVSCSCDGSCDYPQQDLHRDVDGELRHLNLALRELHGSNCKGQTQRANLEPQ